MWVRFILAKAADGAPHILLPAVRKRDGRTQWAPCTITVGWKRWTTLRLHVRCMSSLLCFGLAARVRDDSIVARPSEAQNATRANAAIRPDRAALCLAGTDFDSDQGLTGFYMFYRFDMWDRFRPAAYWWIDPMAAVWVIFTLMLFIVEPFNLHRWLPGRSEPEPPSSAWNGCTEFR